MRKADEEKVQELKKQFKENSAVTLKTAKRMVKKVRMEKEMQEVEKEIQKARVDSPAQEEGEDVEKGNDDEIDPDEFARMLQADLMDDEDEQSEEPARVSSPRPEETNTDDTMTSADEDEQAIPAAGASGPPQKSSSDSASEQQDPGSDYDLEIVDTDAGIDEYQASVRRAMPPPEDESDELAACLEAALAARATSLPQEHFPTPAHTSAEPQQAEEETVEAEPMNYEGMEDLFEDEEWILSVVVLG
jgi:hypothetical protein